MTEHVNICAKSLMRPDNYTGYWEVLWPNGKLQYRGHFIDGAEVGQQVCYWEDGTIAQVSWRDPAGNPRGTTASFYPDGDKQTEEIWEHESRHPGTFVRRAYDANGDVISTATYREFEEIESWERDSLDEESSEMIDKIVADAIRKIGEGVGDEDEE